MPTGNQRSCEIIIVTHNSEKDLPHCLECIQNQTCRPTQIIIVDSASKDPTYLLSYKDQTEIKIHLSPKNLGFCEGNNVGFSLLNPNSDFVLFLNPDAFLTPTFIESALQTMRQNSKCGALTGTLLGYDRQKGMPTGLYDSTGIFNKWYGRWFDRDQGKPVNEKLYQEIASIPAICGALMFCRMSALKTALLENSAVFDPSFFMYKEDIDLSIRLRKKNWDLLFCPQLKAYHCRGWADQSSRKEIPHHLRLHAAKNELTIHFKNNYFVKTVYSFFKLCAVKFLDI